MSRAAPTRQHGNQHGPQRATLRELDGAERISDLPLARTIALAPGLPPGLRDGDEGPTYAVIVWWPGAVECPCPGSALWRAVLEQFLENEALYPTTDASSLHDNPVRAAVIADLQRFPSLEAWLRWRDHDRTVPERRP
jgi:hypothetical protein